MLDTSCEVVKKVSAVKALDPGHLVRPRCLLKKLFIFIGTSMISVAVSCVYGVSS